MIKLSIYLFSKFVLRAIFCFINPDDFPQLIWIGESLLNVYEIQQNAKIKDKNDPARINVYKYHTVG
jgi:hypothetical protein